MADSTHLEKMGRELKCPICLSLLSSAVSLTCNHVFCNLCLTKSMKADSHCPVCKVPYRRREIRPAPHMDNLVSIYKTMEVASGVNIHVTQNAPVAKAADGKNQLDGNSSLDRSDLGEYSRGKPKTQRKLRKGKSKELMKTDDEASGPQVPAKPSFPAKKRVHVPQCLESETPTRIAKCEGRLSKQVEKGPWDGSNVLKEKPSFTARGEPVFSPFFWLREREEGDKDDSDILSSPTMDIERVTNTPLKFSFSDIKDSEDESTIRAAEHEKLEDQPKQADILDSEMFEWTQRPCSPELGSTPVKNKVVYQTKLDSTQEINEGPEIFTATREEPFQENTIKGNGSTEKKPLSSRKDEKEKSRNGITKSDKVGKSKRKQIASTVVAVHSDIEGLYRGSDHFTNEVISNSNMVKKTSMKKRKKISDAKALKKVLEEAPQSNEVKFQNQSELNMGTSTGLSRDEFENVCRKNDLHRTIKTRKSQRSKCKSQNENADTSVAERTVNGEKSSQKPFQEGGDYTCLADEICSGSMKIEKGQRKHIENFIERKRFRTSRDAVANSLLSEKVLKGCKKAARKKIQTFTGCENTSKNKDKDNLQPMGMSPTVPKDMSLRKCDSIIGQKCCAFCQTSNDSEVSGEMMHYSKGRPVAPDYNGGSSIIHAHRKCAEWAPNVYFEDLIAINLEPEVARSKRIKCSCCGIKGAALGCFEKSCRKSFHVPCAKLMPECRWDTENFVMLCPLHSTSKLPKELPGSQVKRRKPYTPRRDLQTHQAEVPVHHGVSKTCSWKGSSNKLVLCCSGLTTAEKEIVSEFAKLAGVSLSKTYQPSVTHIISSTDEKGACRRTLKFLLGILDGKWILKIDWLKACMKATELVSEEEYEIGVDIHGIRDGPQLGRLRILNKQPKLFNGCSFYLMGEFLPSYKGYLQDLVVAAGGTVLHRKPISGDTCGLSDASTFIVYNAEPPEEHGSVKKSLHNYSREEAEVLAKSAVAKVVAHYWLLDSIAACSLQSC